MEDISKKYLTLLTKREQKALADILKIYLSSIRKASVLAHMRYGNLTGKEFNLDAYPLLKRELEKLTRGMRHQVVEVIRNAIKDAWELSNRKNDEMTVQAIEKKFPEIRDYEGASVLFNHNKAALEAFVSRVDKGLNLSERVWKLVKPYKHEIEAALTDGINKGKSAPAMARDMKRFLQEPERLFRRVRDENEKLQLSKAARDYHPGQGVYRSSYKNALRLTGTETNIAYRKADHERWKDATTITAIEIKLSNNPNHCEMCAALIGLYPKDFFFVGNHPSCRCYAVPVLITDEEFRQMRKFRLGKLDKKPGINFTDTIPKNALAWYESNAKRIAGWKNVPYVIRFNPKYLGKYG